MTEWKRERIVVSPACFIPHLWPWIRSRRTCIDCFDPFLLTFLFSLRAGSQSWNVNCSACPRFTRAPALASPPGAWAHSYPGEVFSTRVEGPWRIGRVDRKAEGRRARTGDSPIDRRQDRGDARTPALTAANGRRRELHFFLSDSRYSGGFYAPPRLRNTLRRWMLRGATRSWRIPSPDTGTKGGKTTLSMIFSRKIAKVERLEKGWWRDY